MDSRPKQIRGAQWLALVLLLAAYANSFNNAFHFDDFHTVTDNASIRSLANVPRFFTDATTFSVLPANRTYRPIVSTSLALDYALGRGYVPFWFHFATFCWFLLLLWLLFRLYTLMMERMGAGDAAVWLGLLGAAWFGLHPAMAETVNYVIQRGDLYCTLGCVAALFLYVCYPERRRLGLYLLPLVLALLSKPPAAVFPVLLFLWVFFFESEGTNRLRKAALAILPSLAVVALLLILQSVMTPKSFAPTILSASAYRLTQPYVWLRYCAELFLPLHLNVDTDLSPFAPLNGKALLGLVFLAAMLWAIWKSARNRRLYPIAFALLWFVVTQLPTSLYPLSEVENDHRMFFSFAGLIPGVVWAGWLLLQRLTSPESRKRMTPVLAGVALLALLGYAYGTHVRNAVWHDEESLWHDDAEKSPENGRGLMIYGLTLMNRADYPGALDLFNRALRYTPNYATLEINLGVVNGLLGNQAEAERHFQRAITLQPNDDTTHAYYGRWLIGQARSLEAVNQLRTAVAENPSRALQWELLIQAQRDSGDVEGARRTAAQLAAAIPTETATAAALQTPVKQDAAYWINRSLAQYRARNVWGLHPLRAQGSRARPQIRPGLEQRWCRLWCLEPMDRSRHRRKAGSRPRSQPPDREEQPRRLQRQTRRRPRRGRRQRRRLDQSFPRPQPAGQLSGKHRSRPFRPQARSQLRGGLQQHRRRLRIPPRLG